MTKSSQPADSRMVKLVLHTKGERDRLAIANRHQSDDIFALTAALREVYGILKSKSFGHTDDERIELASKHIASVIGRFGAFMPRSVKTDAQDQETAPPTAPVP